MCLFKIFFLNNLKHYLFQVLDAVNVVGDHAFSKHSKRTHLYANKRIEWWMWPTWTVYRTPAIPNISLLDPLFSIVKS